MTTTIPGVFEDHPHRRLDVLTGQWILVSPHRAKRPWQGQQEKSPPDDRPRYDPKCYLCPGNERAGGARNPQYTGTFVFANDFAALLPECLPGTHGAAPAEQLFQVESVPGTCRVICFSPRHDLTLPRMSADEIRSVIDLWAEQTTKLGGTYRWVQVFENKGSIMGCSNPHPHGQIWASDSLPNEPAKEHDWQADYFARAGSPLLVDYADREQSLGERIVVENGQWLAVVPFWATWPYETLVLPKRHVRRLPELDDQQRGTLSGLLKRLLTRYDNLFETSFPYSMGWHGAPFDASDSTPWQLHAHFYPPLLRSATVREFMVGYEMLSEAQRDLTPEQAAHRLRSVPETHYMEDRSE